MYFVMEKLLLIVLMLVCGNSFSQNYKITYLRSSNGTLIDGQDPIVVYSNESLTRVISKSIDENSK